MTQAAPARLDALFPLSAGRNLLLDPALGELTAGRVHAALVIAGWGALSLAGAFALFRRRDVR
jgi:ABC-2 type transport system permease protein